MLNPILTRRVYFIAYVLIWMFIAVLQVGLEYYFFHLDLPSALADSLTVNMIHLITALAVWYPVRFNPVTGKNFLTPLINITATGFLTVIVWVGTPWIILKNIFASDPAFLDFLNTSLPYRIVTDVLFYIVLVLVYSLIVYSANLREKISNESNLRMLVREAELNALKAQINPHFLFNSLNSISLLTMRDPSRAREMIVKLSDFLRYSLRSGDDETTTLQEELENMKRYLDIEKIRFGEKLVYENSCDEGLMKASIPNMILQPLLENAVKHGVYESIEPISIHLDITDGEKGVHISVTNDFDPGATPRKGAGIGLKNIIERLKLLYGRDDLLSYRKNSNTFYVELIIPQ